MSTMRAYTREFRESAVGLVLSEGLSIRKAADDLGMPYHTLHGWVRAARRSRREPVQKVQPRTKADAEARVRELEAEVRKRMLERDILKKGSSDFRVGNPTLTAPAAAHPGRTFAAGATASSTPRSWASPHPGTSPT